VGAMAEEKERCDLPDLVKLIEKRFGSGFISKASSAKALNIKRIPTGIFPVDLAVGGGIPRGRITTLFGMQSSCKTGIALKIVSQLQLICRNCLHKEASCECEYFEPSRTLWLDAEGVYDNDWAEKIGVNNDNVYVIRTETAEQAIDIADTSLRSGNFDLLVVDSIAHLTPMTEIENSAEKWQVGLLARLINKMLRKIVSAMNAYGVNNNKKPTVLLINHIRQKVGVLYGDPETRPGGLGQFFASSLELRLSGGGYSWMNTKGTAFVKQPPKEGEAPAKVDVRFTVRKNKVGVPRRNGVFPFWLRETEGHTVGDTEEIATILKYAKSYNLLYKENNLWHCGSFTAKTQAELLDAVKNDSDTINSLRDLLFEI